MSDALPADRYNPTVPDVLLDQMGAEYASAFRDLERAAHRRNALTEAERELVLLAVTSAIHLNDADATRTHIRNALRAGASSSDVRAAMSMGLGVHTITQCVPVLLDELAATGVDVAIPTDDELTPSEREFKTEYEHKRGYWYPGWNRMLRVDPEYLRAYLEISSVRPPGWSPRMRELTNIAVDAATTHLYLSGVRVHIRNALEIGIPADEILEVLEIVSLVGHRTLTMSLPLLAEETGRS